MASGFFYFLGLVLGVSPELALSISICVLSTGRYPPLVIGALERARVPWNATCHWGLFGAWNVGVSGLRASGLG
jgi:hypothetical protein